MRERGLFAILNV